MTDQNTNAVGTAAAPTSPEQSAAPRSEQAPGQIPLPSRDELEREQLKLNNKKVEVETRKLVNDMEPQKWWEKLIKNAVALGSVITVAGAAYGFYSSYDKSITDQKEARRSDQHTRIEEAIKRLESSNLVSRLVGISVLSGYLNKENEQAHQQVLFTLAALAATDNDPQAQSAITNLIASIPRDGPISRQNWRYFQETLVTQSRAVVVKSNLFRYRQFNDVPPSDSERAARTVGTLIALVARKNVLLDAQDKPNYSDYRGIFCEYCDFRRVAFPPETDFSGAVLGRANFSGSALQRAFFDNAELNGAVFVEADLEGARFRSIDDKMALNAGETRVTPGRTEYLDHIVESLGTYATASIQMPNFSCANLEGAIFENHASFVGLSFATRKYSKEDAGKPGWYQTVSQFHKDEAASKPIEFPALFITPMKLFKADIKGAHFEKARFFAINNGADDFSATWMSFGNGQRWADFVVFLGTMSSNGAFDADHDAGRKSTSKPPDDVKRALTLFRQRLHATFYSTNFGSAFLPDAVAEFLKKSPPSESDLKMVLMADFDSDMNPDEGCKPRSGI